MTILQDFGHDLVPERQQVTSSMLVSTKKTMIARMIALIILNLHLSDLRQLANGRLWEELTYHHSVRLWLDHHIGNH